MHVWSLMAVMVYPSSLIMCFGFVSTSWIFFHFDHILLRFRMFAYAIWILTVPFSTFIVSRGAKRFAVSFFVYVFCNILSMLFHFPFRIVDDYQTYRPCGNSSGAQTCPNGNECLSGNHSIVNNGITSFDTISASFLVIVRLFQRDYWEELLHYLTATTGPWSILFFIAIIYYGSFQLCALLWTPVALAYNYLNNEVWENDLLNDLKAVSIRSFQLLARAHSVSFNLFHAILKSQNHNKSWERVKLRTYNNMKLGSM